MPLQGGIQIFGAIGPGPGDQEPCPDKVAQYFFQGLAVLLVDAEQEEGQHEANHQQYRRVVADKASGKDIGGYSHQRPAAKADELTLC